MIYTVTLNPSLDYIVDVKEFQLGKTNRTEKEKILPGGKGLNVSMVLVNLGCESTAYGFVAGFVGEEIRRRMKDMGCGTDFIPLQSGISRINIKLRSCEGTEINGQGPDIPMEAVEQLLAKLDQLDTGDCLVLAGSIPPTMPDSIYESILQRLKEKEIRTIVDATGELLKKVLPYHPFLIKPNQDELLALFDVTEITIKTRDDVVPYGKKLQTMGARNVLVSMGGKGAVLIAENGIVYDVEAPEGQVINAVGAGDSMVAGFLASWLEKGDYQEAFYQGVSAGSASAFSENLATRQEVADIYQRLKGYTDK
ncbi:MAG: 1-phosphofructokinase [Lachnospiraceae bacterium]|nr:1-phosphofructokinase [Lachnospiraceae bacterium]